MALLHSEALVLDFLENIRHQLSLAPGDERKNEILQDASRELETQYEYVGICAEALLLYRPPNGAIWAKSLEHLQERPSHTRMQVEQLRCLANTTATWGQNIVTHYRFSDYGRRGRLKLLNVVKRYPNWTQLVQRINVALLCRHISKAEGACRIGSHPGRWQVKDPSRPICALDLQLVLDWAAEKTIEILGTKWPDNAGDLPGTLRLAMERCGSEACGLKFDEHGLIVPSQPSPDSWMAVSTLLQQTLNSSEVSHCRNARMIDNYILSAHDGVDVADDADDADENVGIDTELDDNESVRSRDTRPDKRRQTGGKGIALSGRSQTGGLRLPNTNPNADECCEEQEMSSREQNSSNEREGSPDDDFTARAHHNRRTKRRCVSGNTPRTLCPAPGFPPSPSPSASSDLFVRDERVSPLPDARADAFSEHSACSTPTNVIERVIHGYAQFGDNELPQAPDCRRWINEAEHGQTIADRTLALGEERAIKPVEPQSIEEDTAALFSLNCPECAGACHTGCNVQDSAPLGREVHAQLLEFRERIRSINESDGLGLAAWTNPMRMAKICFEPWRPNLSGQNEYDIYSCKNDYLERLQNIEIPLIIKHAVTRPYERVRQSEFADVRQFTGAQIETPGGTWLRSLHGTQLCMIVPEDLSDTSYGDPRGRSRAFFLEGGDIFVTPKRIRIAMVTAPNGRMEVGCLKDQACGDSVTMPQLRTIFSFVFATPEG